MLIIVILILGGLFYYFAPDSMKFWDGQTASIIDSVTDNEDSEPIHETITAKHQYKNGTHTIVGEVNMPNPCYLLDTSSVVSGKEVTISFIASTTDDICAQVVTVERFRFDFNASSDATIRATWNGKPVELNLIPAGADEDLLDFEIYIK